MTTANVTTTTYRSDDIVPFRRPQGDLDNRYMPQAYALVRSWPANLRSTVQEFWLPTDSR